jgi:hypothetical protein
MRHRCDHGRASNDGDVLLLMYRGFGIHALDWSNVLQVGVVGGLDQVLRRWV